MKLRKVLKWVGITVVTLFVLAFMAFLYFIPPFTIAPPEQFIDEEKIAPPSLADISDPAERLVAEHGKYIVGTSGCTGCHTAQGDKGPAWDRYLAGGMKLSQYGQGGHVSRNLTPDKETGLARWKDEDVRRILRTGLDAEGRMIPHRLMPWAAFSRWTEEDRYAVVTYLHHLKPVKSTIPGPFFSEQLPDPKAVEAFYGVDFSKH